MDKKAIWIDLDNSPHVPLFVPIIRHYRAVGVEVILTARDHSQTIELLDVHGLTGTYKVIGRHYGKGKLNKVQGLVHRAVQLFSYVRNNKSIAIAVSHGSRSMVLAAKGLRIPVITMYDYEFTETRIFNRFSNRVLVPDGIPDQVLNEIKLPARKCKKYPGIKEELYVRNFKFNPDLRLKYLGGIYKANPAEWCLVVLRPPATTANYHVESSTALFVQVLTMLVSTPKVYTVVAPRTKEQGEEIRSMVIQVNSRASCIILDHAVNGLELAAASDLLISGGGTMNREAALLGVPVYSIFAGRQGALDRQMEAEGLITFIRDARDLSKIRIERRASHTPAVLTDRVERFVIKEIDEFL